MSIEQYIKERIEKLQSNKDPDWEDWNNWAIVELTRVLSKIEEIQELNK